MGQFRGLQSFFGARIDYSVQIRNWHTAETVYFLLFMANAIFFGILYTLYFLFRADIFVLICRKITREITRKKYNTNRFATHFTN